LDSLLAFPPNYNINVGASLKNVLHILGGLPTSKDDRLIKGQLADIVTYFPVSRLPINADANQISIPANELGHLLRRLQRLIVTEIDEADPVHMTLQSGRHVLQPRRREDPQDQAPIYQIRI